jgi:hypothetical protein
MHEAIGMWARFCISIQTNLNRAQDIPMGLGQRLVQQPLYGSDF